MQWRQNGSDSVPNHQPRDCLLNRLFRRRSKKTSTLRVTGLCARIHRGPVNSPHKWPVTRKMFLFDDVIMYSVISSLITTPSKYIRAWMNNYIHCFALDVIIHPYPKFINGLTNHNPQHYNNTTMGTMVSQINSLTIVYSTVMQAQIKENIKLRVTGLCVGNSPFTGEFPAQMASNAGSISFDDVIMVYMDAVTYPFPNPDAGSVNPC